MADIAERAEALDPWPRRPPPATWAPRQCRTLEDSWDQRYWNQDDEADGRRGDVSGTALRGDLVPAGRYRVEVAWNSAPRDHPPRPQPAVTTEPFTVGGSARS
ncbi:MAG: hypothetical protein ACRDZ9_00815 [Acidimicrobiales bacterium]